MSTQEVTNPQEAAQQIWNTLDAEDNGTTPPPEVKSNSIATEDANPVATAAPADKADAHAANEEDALSPREQALMDRIAGMEAQFTQRLRSVEGHIGGLNNKLKQAVQPVAQPAGNDAPSAQQLSQARTDPEAMAKLKTDYPEFATAMDAALTERMADMERRIAEARPSEQANPGVSQEDLVRLQNNWVIESKHEGWETTVRKPEFGGWLQRQAREVQMLATSADPRDAIRLLDLHTEANKPAPQQTDQRLTQAAAIPAGRSASNIRAKPTDQMTDKEYWAYLDQTERSKKG